MLGLALLFGAHGVHASTASDQASVADFAGGGGVPATQAPAGEVEIFVVANPAHSDIIIPRSAFGGAPPLIKSVVDKLDAGPWVIIGWGPYWFGRAETPVYHALPALWAVGAFTLVVPQFRSRIRLAPLAAPGPPPGEQFASTMVSIQIPAAGLERAIERINASFETGPDGGPIPDLAGVAPGVMLYRSKELYHITHECNHWVAEVLHAGGVKTTPFVDVIPGTLELNLKIAGAKSAPPLAADPPPAR
jgi:hypothetical protein